MTSLENHSTLSFDSEKNSLVFYLDPIHFTDILKNMIDHLYNTIALAIIWTLQNPEAVIQWYLEWFMETSVSGGQTVLHWLNATPSALKKHHVQLLKHYDLP